MKESNILTEWKNRPCVLGTMHGKERVIAPLVESELDLTVVVPKDFNTDHFGTFTGDIKRAGNQREACRTKALSAMTLTGTDLALASEGSFGAHPGISFLSSNLEIVMLIDKLNDLEIIGHYRNSTVIPRGQKVRTSEEAIATALSWGFPKQGIIIRESEKSTKNIFKEVLTIEDIQTLSTHLLSKWFVKSIYIETDMRAHRCPERMEFIRLATLDLIKNCKSICPRCSTPGFVITETVSGLPCASCTLPTDLVKETIRSCTKCTYQLMSPIENEVSAEAKDCVWCNP